jgi:phosphohistidine phosphatase
MDARASDELTLHLLRHAHAGDAEAWQGDDAQRPLSKRGRGQAERLGAFLAEHRVRVDRIVSSPMVRARETAELVGDALDVPVALDDRLGSGLDLDDLAGLLADHGGRAPMLVGHDPDFSLLVQELCRTDSLTMRKGTLATLELDGPPRAGAATLRWLVPPDLLER